MHFRVVEAVVSVVATGDFELFETGDFLSCCNVCSLDVAISVFELLQLVILSCCKLVIF